MHLSPVKGAFPHKDQHDRTAPVVVNETNKGIERGSVICYDPENKGFTLATDATVFPMYLALQNYGDLQATMAGMYSPANGKEAAFPYAPGSWKEKGARASAGMTGRATATQPAITGIHMDDGDVWETDMFDEESLKNAKPNDKLTVENGLIKAAAPEATTGIVGFLVEPPYRRYANDAVAVKDMMTGAYIQVIQFQCGK